MLESTWQEQVHALPARVPPLPWEDLGSFISRMAAHMGYQYPGWILHPEALEYIIPDRTLGILRKKSDYELLGRLLNVDEEVLYQLTLHRFATRVQSPRFYRDSAAKEIQRALLSPRNLKTLTSSAARAKVCPICLAELVAYGRLYWNVAPVVSCLKHCVYLIDRCPVCQKNIPLLRPSLVACPLCKTGDYRYAQLTPLPEDPFVLVGQGWILLQLGIEVEEQNGWLGNLTDSPLRELFSWQYFRLLDAFRCLLYPLFPDHPFLRVSPGPRATFRPLLTRGGIGLSSSEWTAFLSTFHFVFSSWPDRFFTLLKVLQSIGSIGPDGAGVAQDYGPFYRSWLYGRLKEPAFSFLREAFENFIKNEYRRGAVDHRLRSFHGKEMEIIQERTYVTQSQAKRMLGIAQNTLNKLIRNGVLHEQRRSLGTTGKQCCVFIEKVDVEELLREWNNLLTADTIARSYFGTSEDRIRSLSDARLLVAVKGPPIDQHYAWLYRREDVERLSVSLLSCAEPTEHDTGEWISLSKAACFIRMTLTNILVEILNGHLKPVDLGTPELLFQRLVLSRHELERFLQEREQYRCETLGLLNIHEAATYLRVDGIVLRRWIEHGLLVGEHLVDKRGNSCLFVNREELEAFHRTYVCTQEAKELLGLTSHALIRNIEQGLLHLVEVPKRLNTRSVLLFSREEIVRQQLLNGAVPTFQPVCGKRQ